MAVAVSVSVTVAVAVAIAVVAWLRYIVVALSEMRHKKINIRITSGSILFLGVLL